MNGAGDRRRDEQRHDELSQAILQYLAEHPHAADTVEGIAEWWLTRQRVRVDVQTIAKVLHELSERGLLEETGTGDHRRYRLKD